jgi:isochorismate hydrolase
VVQQIAPGEEDFILLKPKHSAFYATPLAELLEAAGAKRLILTGVTSHQCVLFTANDAYLRELELLIPRDCIAAPESRDTRLALQYFTLVLDANVRPSTRLRLASR